MKKLFLMLFLSGLCTLAASYVAAQRLGPCVTHSLVGRTPPVVAKTSSVIAPPVVSRVRQINMASEPEIVSRTTLENLRPFIQNAQAYVSLLPRMSEQISPFLMDGIFQARPSGMGKINPFSGTIFYSSEGEIFGVVVAHAIATYPEHLDLRRHFTADIYVNGEFISVPVEIVQITSPRFIDLALVKFPPEVEPFLSPFPLETQPLPFGQLVQTIGFVRRDLIDVTRQFLKEGPVAMHVSVPTLREGRPGLCGSPVLVPRANGIKKKLVGIHIGSSSERYKDTEDIGYAAPASLLEVLVQAYHNNGVGTFDLKLNNHIVAKVGVNEYLTQMVLLNEKGEKVFEKDFSYKFPYHKVKEWLEIFIHVIYNSQPNGYVGSRKMGENTWQ